LPERLHDITDKTEQHRLNYINSEQKVISDIKAQNINGIDKALLPNIEEKKFKYNDTKRRLH